jgi:HK97 family phage prohead protease
MKITVRKQKVVIDGYVNAVDRFSRPLFEGFIGRFIEKVLPNAFKRAIARAKNIEVLLNHDETRKLAETADGSAKIYEDNVGLRAVVEITDAEVVQKAKEGKLRGWSFGFSNPSDTQSTNADGVIERVITDLDLHEVSIIDDRALPAYIGTSIEARAIGTTTIETRIGADTEIDTRTDDAGEQDDTQGDKPTEKDTQNPESKDKGDKDAEREAKAKLESERIARDNAIKVASI